ncbi:MAG: BspA family leucine-rich repeat surface protein, partial [Thaumarchaeota archaeon]|nr:BspA family leucine-rich repeat surface protein [Nitrososphaerota archaeon]
MKKTLQLSLLIAVAVSVPLLFSDVSAAECGVEDYQIRRDEIVNTNGAFIIIFEASAPNQEIIIPSIDDTTEYGVIWDGGNADKYTGDASFTYRTSGPKIITIEKTFPGINFEKNLNSAIQLKEIRAWGDVKWSTMEGAFYGTANMNITAIDMPDLSNVKNMDRMFAYARSLNADISSWDVSGVTSMEQTFLSAQMFNQPLNSWDVSSVRNMSGMFANATSFNQDISSWDVSGVTDMSGMFLSASSFNQPLNLDISSVTDTSDMFNGATSFNQPLQNWNMSSVTDMSSMFANATSFNQPLYLWNTASVTNMSNVFNGATSFNSHVGINPDKTNPRQFEYGWNTSAVTDMSGMFANATSFNKELRFDTAKV